MDFAISRFFQKQKKLLRIEKKNLKFDEREIIYDDVTKHFLFQFVYRQILSENFQSQLKIKTLNKI